MKLSVFDIVHEAYEFIWQERRKFWLLAMPGVIGLSILATLMEASIINSGLTGGDGAIRGSIMVFAFVLFIANLAVVNLYSVAWHRMYLASEQFNVRRAYIWAGRQNRFFLVYVKLVLMMIVPVGIASLAGFAIGFIALFAMMWLFARLSVLLPAMAVDKPLTMVEGYKLTQNNGWRLFWILACSLMIAALATMPVNWLILHVIGGTGIAGTLTGSLLLNLVQLFFAFLGIAVGVSALSIAYNKLIESE